MDAAPTTLPGLTRVFRTAEGIEAVAASLRAGGAGTIDGAWGSSAGLAVATLVEHSPGPVLVVIAHPGDVEGWSNELASFCPHRPVLFPAFESWPPDLSKFDDTPRKRLRLVQQLSADPALMSSMGAAARERALVEFSPARMLEEHTAAYERAVASR